MTLYAGIDLHGNNNYLGIVDEHGKRIFKKKLRNEPMLILETLAPYEQQIAGVVVESTFNWYWLVDLLKEAGYQMHLSNPCGNKVYSGLKHRNDQHDAFWLADLLRLEILKEGYIYPKETRPIRDLLRTRGKFVQMRTSTITSLKCVISRNCGINVKSNDIKRLREDHVSPLLDYNEDIALSGRKRKVLIDFFTRHIREIEKEILGKIDLESPYRKLTTIPGIGKILALTIMLETGPIERFAKVGNYVSYCRKVSSKWSSNEKVKGKGNKKNGNKYLAWAFSEAAEFARRYDQRCRAYYNRKKQAKNLMVAHNALAHKLARAAYYIMRDQQEYKAEKLFA